MKTEINLNKHGKKEIFRFLIAVFEERGMSLNEINHYLAIPAVSSFDELKLLDPESFGYEVFVGTLRALGATVSIEIE